MSAVIFFLFFFWLCICYTVKSKVDMCGRSVYPVISRPFSALFRYWVNWHGCNLRSSNSKQTSTSVPLILLEPLCEVSKWHICNRLHCQACWHLQLGSPRAYSQCNVHVGQWWCESLRFFFMKKKLYPDHFYLPYLLPWWWWCVTCCAGRLLCACRPPPGSGTWCLPATLWWLPHAGPHWRCHGSALSGQGWAHHCCSPRCSRPGSHGSSRWSPLASPTPQRCLLSWWLPPSAS